MSQRCSITRLPYAGPRVLLAVAGAFACALPAAAQTEGANGAGAVLMQMKLEKTFLKVDVVALDVRVEGETADWLRQLAHATEFSEAVADTVTHMVLDADSATVTLHFLRGASLEHFLKEVNGGMRKAVAAGLLSGADAEAISASMPGWYAVLEGRGVRSGDRQVHVIRGDSMTTRFIDAAGSVLLDHQDVGRAGRSAVIASYFSPGSHFRAPLVRSLFR